MPSKQPVPQYKQYPDLYAFNKRTNRYALKRGDAYKRDILQHPDDWIEAQALQPHPTRGLLLPVPPNPPVPEVKTQIGPPNPPLPLPPLTADQQREKDEEATINRIRERMRPLILAELKANPSNYEGKSADEMSAQFRKMLIERLAPVSKPKPQVARGAPVARTVPIATLRPEAPDRPARRPMPRPEFLPEDEFDDLDVDDYDEELDDE